MDYANNPDWVKTGECNKVNDAGVVVAATSFQHIETGEVVTVDLPVNEAE